MLGEIALRKEDRGTSKSKPAHLHTETNTVGILSQLKDTDWPSAMTHNNSLITGTIINLNDSKCLIVWMRWHWGPFYCCLFYWTYGRNYLWYGIYGKSIFTFNPQQNLNVLYGESLLFTDNWRYLVHYSFKSSFPGHNKGYLGGQDGELVFDDARNLKCQVFKKGQTTLSHKKCITYLLLHKKLIKTLFICQLYTTSLVHVILTGCGCSAMQQLKQTQNSVILRLTTKPQQFPLSAQTS